MATERTESSIENEICYTGAIYDATTSLYYMNARYYDPSIGRFISEDTYRGEDNNYDEWHLYAYCANNPINYVDPSGHKRKNTKPKSRKISSGTANVKLNHNYVSAYGAIKEGGTFVLTKKCKTKIMKALTTKLGSKFVPILNACSVVLEIYCTVQSIRGYKYTKVYVKYEKWSTYKMQGGKWATGVCYKNCIMKISLTND